MAAIMLGNRVWKVAQKELCSRVAAYTVPAASHMHYSDANTPSLRPKDGRYYILFSEAVSKCSRRLQRGYWFVSWSTNKYIVWVHFGGGGSCAVSNVKRTQLIWLMDGSKCSPGPEGDLQEKCTVPYNTHKNAHINIPSRWVPLASSRAHCVDAHVCARTHAHLRAHPLDDSRTIWISRVMLWQIFARLHFYTSIFQCKCQIVFKTRSYCCELFH